MRFNFIAIAVVGLMGLSTTVGVYAQATPATPGVAQPAAVVEAQTAAITACTSGTAAACELALQALATAIRVANPNVAPATISALVIASLTTVATSVQAAGAPAANVAAIGRVAAVEATVTGDTTVAPEVIDTPSASPA